MSEKSGRTDAGQPLRAILLGAGRKQCVAEAVAELKKVVEQHAEVVAEDFTGTPSLAATAPSCARPTRWATDNCP